VNRQLLGRRPYVADHRDQRFLLADVVPTSERTYRYWRAGWKGDQSNTPPDYEGGHGYCVGFGCTHFITCSPRWHASPPVNPLDVYNLAQDNDEWPGDSYAGSSVRGGMKALQLMGKLREYRWAWDIDTLVNFVLERGPVVVGTNWYQDMFYPDSDGWLTIGGSVAGGHAYVIDGCNRNDEKLRILNSWGTDWGRKGRAFLSFSQMARLLAEDGEAASALEAA
jgi:hypothetical protein